MIKTVLVLELNMLNGFRCIIYYKHEMIRSRGWLLASELAGYTDRSRMGGN